MLKVSSVIIQDLWKNKAIIAYGLLMAVLGWGVFAIEDQAQKAVLSLLQVILFVQPLVTLLFAAMYYYNTQEFTLLLAAQPIRRRTLIVGIFLGLATVFTLIFFLSVGLPVLVFAPGAEGVLLMFVSMALILVFTALALLISVYVNDKARGVGVALLLWAFFAFVYDGLLLVFMYQLAAYPIERYVLGLTFFNPIDIGRIMVIGQTEAAALLGLSGAVFKQFFGSTAGLLVSALLLLIWAILPAALTYLKFNRKDL